MCRLKYMQNVLAMLGTASDRLRYLSPGMESLVRGLAAQYPELDFLSKCVNAIENGCPFNKAFGDGVLDEPMQKKTREILMALSDELGQSDLDSQLAALSYANECLREEIAQERAYCAVHCKLYHSLGALGGVALAILLL